MPNLSRAADPGMGDGVRQERRRCARRRILDDGQMVVVEIGSADAGLLVDLSLKGINVQAAKAIPPGTRITSKFQLPGSSVPIQPTYEVVWSDQKGRAGLQFLYIAENEQRELERWMAAQMAMADEQPRPVAPPAPRTIIAALPRKLEDKGSDKDVLGLDFRPLAPPSSEPKPVRVVAVAERKEGPASPETDLNVLVEEAQRLTEADGAAIALRDEQGIVCRARSGNAPDLRVRLNPDAGLSGECVRTARVVSCADVANDPRVPRAAIEQLQLSSILIVPVLAGGLVAGVVEVLSSRKEAFDEFHRATLERIAATVASLMAVDNPGSGTGGSAATKEALGVVVAKPTAQQTAAPPARSALPEILMEEPLPALRPEIAVDEPLQLEVQAEPVAGLVAEEAPTAATESPEAAEAPLEIVAERPRLATVEFEPRTPRTVERLGPMLVMGTSAPDIDMDSEPAAVPFRGNFVLSSYAARPEPRWMRAVPYIVIILILLSTLSGWMVSTGRFPFVKHGSNQVAPAQRTVRPTQPGVPEKVPVSAPKVSPEAKPIGSRIPTRPVQIIPLKPGLSPATGKAPAPPAKAESEPKSKPQSR